MAGIKAGDAVLDAGCGTGALALRAARKVQPGGRVAGIDASPEMIEVAREKAERNELEIDFRVAAIENLPFADGEFDAAVSAFVLHHLPEDVMSKGFAEIRRVLKPGGRFVAVDLAGRSIVGRIIGLFGHAHNMPAIERIQKELESAGFEEVRLVDHKRREVVFITAGPRGSG